jgi:hypothetical protein
MTNFNLNEKQSGAVQRVEEVLSMLDKYAIQEKCYKFYPGEVGTTFHLEVRLVDDETGKLVTLEFNLTDYDVW